MSTAEIALETHDQPQEFAFPLEIAGFWRRIVADVIDLTLLGIILFVPAFFFFRSFFYERGPYGRQYGFIVALIYFTVFSSRLGNGQTLGKRMLDIQVTDQNAKLLSVKHAFVRSAVLLTIYLFNGWNIPILFLSPFAALLASTIVYAGLLSLLYAYIFNRTTRQGPHDLLVGSYVSRVSIDPISRQRAPACPQLHSRMVAGLFAVVLFGLAIISFIANAAGAGANDDLSDFAQTLNEDPRFFTVGVTHRDDYLRISAWYSKDCGKNRCRALFDDLAQVAWTDYQDIDNVNTIDVFIYRAFDLGFATNTVSYGQRYTVNH